MRLESRLVPKDVFDEALNAQQSPLGSAIARRQSEVTPVLERLTELARAVMKADDQRSSAG